MFNQFNNALKLPQAGRNANPVRPSACITFVLGVARITRRAQTAAVNPQPGLRVRRATVDDLGALRDHLALHATARRRNGKTAQGVSSGRGCGRERPGRPWRFGFQSSMRCFTARGFRIFPSPTPRGRCFGGALRRWPPIMASSGFGRRKRRRFGRAGDFNLPPRKSCRDCRRNGKLPMANG